MNEFATALAFVLGWETAWGRTPYTDGSGDPGGETHWGISARAHPDVDIRNLTRDGASAIYRAEYWASDGRQRACCDQLRWPISWVHFDAAVNVGNFDHRGFHGTANKLLQRALGVADDGVIGPKTLGAARIAATLPLACRMIVERQKFYRRIVRGNPAVHLKHFDGWFNRVEDLLVKSVGSA